MADDVILNAGSGGDTIAADEVSGVKYQRIKLAPGGDGAAAYGATSYSYRCAAATNQDSQVVKAAAGVLYGLTVTNSAAYTVYFRLYNLATGPTSASSVWRRYAVPPNGGVREHFPYGVLFTTGLAFRATTGEGDTNATAVAAGDLYVCAEYV